MLRLTWTALVLATVGSLGPADRSPVAVEAEAAAPPSRILYASDWSGTSQIYAADPRGRSPSGQLTFGRAPACRGDNPCGYVEPRPSPDGSRLLFWDTVSGGSCVAGVFVGNADLRARRRIGDAACFLRVAAWSPDSGRVAYLGRDGMHVARADGSSDRLLGGSAQASGPTWSPDSRALAFLSADRALLVARAGRALRLAERAGGFAWSPDSRWMAFGGDGAIKLVRATGGPTRTLAERGSAPVWSPDSRWIAFSGDGAIKLVRATGGPARTLAEHGSAPAWSPDGRFVAFETGDAAGIATIASGVLRSISAPSVRWAVWAPRGHLLALVDSAGIQVVDAATGRARRIAADARVFDSVVWSPDGRSVAYLAPVANPAYGFAQDLRVANVTGGVRTVVAASGRYGGQIHGWAWTRPRTTPSYRRPAARTVATITPTDLVAPWAITSLAADGGRVAYVSCGHVFVWAPAAGTVVQADPLASASPWCSHGFGTFLVYSLALADDRVAYGSALGNAGRTWSLGGMTLGNEQIYTLEAEFGAGGGAGARGLGDLVGARNLLLFSRWTESPPSSPMITKQTLFRVDGTACPCSATASSDGPLVPFDVDDGRVVAGGTNETWLLDAGGRRLLTIPFSPVAAQLSRDDLVLVRRGELRHYDAVTGARLNAWSLPDVPSGWRCGTPSGSRCGPLPQLVLEDAARGLVVYVLDGQVHLLRLADGADAVIAPGTLARFMDAGLVYAEGSRLHLVPFDRLPLR